MTADDIDAVARLRVRAWQSAYADLMPRPYLDAMSVAEDAARRREMFAKADGTISNFVTEDAHGAVTGWAAIGPDRIGGAHTRAAPRAERDAELYAIYVLPELIGTGLGRELTEACLERARGRGFGRVLLWVVEGNSRARRFYERAGFAADGTQDTEDIDGRGTYAPVPVVRYARSLAGGPFTGSGSA
ncbi:N-acetyltransferase [Streptomyces sp. HNM0575]|nr:N-acetyltransferase [Streptomyces sp. HNM0575]